MFLFLYAPLRYEREIFSVAKEHGEFIGYAETVSSTFKMMCFYDEKTDIRYGGVYHASANNNQINHGALDTGRISGRVFRIPVDKLYEVDKVAMNQMSFERSIINIRMFDKKQERDAAYWYIVKPHHWYDHKNRKDRGYKMYRKSQGANLFWEERNTG